MTHPFVSRGGVKLAAALKEFHLDVKNKICLDIGASTGGFTDCLLQHGAARVYAVDVGYGILAWKLRTDPRVVVVERTNARHLNWEMLQEKIITSNQQPVTSNQQPELAVIDVSFISLAKIFPAVYNLLTTRAEVVALIKPQFEARREQVERGGIVRDEKVRQEVVAKTRREAEAVGFKAQGLIESPITGADGNVEFLLHLRKE